MNTQSDWSNGLWHSTPSRTAAGNKRQAHSGQVSQETIELTQWANAQALALSKLKIFHAMAKQVNDQQ
ncbi:MAG TPA: hypothetical protein VEC35_14910 [Noviherbaspirillum sp.]|nr:hypothetical protein [Noviherbaspirillum sp.]